MGEGDRSPPEEYLVSFPGAYSLDGEFDVCCKVSGERVGNMLTMNVP